MKAESEIFSGRRLTALIVPLILEQILGITVGMADSIMVSSAGEAAVSGVSLVDTINILLINTFVSLATGGAVVAAHRLGEKKREEAVKTADQLLLCVTGIAVVIMIFALICNRWLLRGIYGNVEKTVMDNAVIYFYITAVSFPFMGIYNSCAALSRAMGNSKITMYVSVVMNVINVIGNAVMIRQFHVGVYGVALSTLVSRILGAVIMMKILMDPGKPLHFSGRIKSGPDSAVIRKIMQVGIPTGLDNCIFQVGKILVQSLVAGLGTASITANAIVGTVAGIATIPASAIGTAMITVVGQTVGAGKIAQAKRYVRRLMLMAYGGMVLINLLIVLGSGWIVGWYSVSDVTAKMAVELIIFHSVCAACLWPTGFSLPNVMRAAYDATFTMAVSVGSMWTFRIGCSYLFCRYFCLGLFGIWAAMGVDWIFRSVCFVWRFKSGRWLKNINLSGESEERA